MGATRLDSKIRVIIAEDNPDAQEILAGFMEPLNAFEVIAIVDNGEHLLELNFKKKPNLIIADINMPLLNGIEAYRLCKKVNPELNCIFTTGYQQYAVSAFDLNAVDYVMKPIKKERLYRSLEKAKSLINNNKKSKQKKILSIQINRDYYFIPFKKIIFIEKVDRKTRIHTKEETYETNESLDRISSKLDSDFFRTHRSFIVNVYCISHITLEGETYLAHLREYPHFVHVSKLRVKELYKEIQGNSK